MEVPATIRLAGQDLIGHIADKPFVQTQARLIQQDLPLQRAAAVGDGSSETAGALTAHLRRRVKEITERCFKANVLSLLQLQSQSLCKAEQKEAIKTVIKKKDSSKRVLTLKYQNNK